MSFLSSFFLVVHEWGALGELGNADEVARSHIQPRFEVSRRVPPGYSHGVRRGYLRGNAPTCIRKSSQPVSLLYWTTCWSTTVAMLMFWNRTLLPVGGTPNSLPWCVPVKT
jgi:hypothetical protein